MNKQMFQNLKYIAEQQIEELSDEIYSLDEVSLDDKYVTLDEMLKWKNEFLDYVRKTIEDSQEFKDFLKNNPWAARDHEYWQERFVSASEEVAESNKRLAKSFEEAILNGPPK